MSIKYRIYFSFFLLVFLFVINGIVTIVTLNNSKKLSKHIAEVVDPSIHALGDFQDMMINSKMYSTNWVFIRASENDKDALKRLHASGYPDIKTRLSSLSANWYSTTMTDTLQTMFSSFEQLLLHEKYIMNTLVKFEDYDDPTKRFTAEEIVENEVLTHTTSLMASIDRLLSKEQASRIMEEKELENSSMLLSILISFLAIIIIILALFLSSYMTKRIINPINTIRFLINDLGKGITKRVEYKANGDEIGEMITSVNNLAEKLEATAMFAHQVGKRNFSIPFKPLSEADALGKSLITMRDNIKSSDERLNEAQHIARLGGWERDLKNNFIVWSDEMFRIFDIDPANFNYTYQTYLDLIHPDDLEYVKNIGKNYLVDHQPISYECRIITPKGIQKIIRAEGKVVLNDKNEVSKTYGIVQDITEQKKSRLELEKAHREMQTLFENIDEVFFSMDMVEYKLLQMSPACEKVYGHQASEFFKNPMLWLEVTLEEDKKTIEANEGIMRGGKSIQHESRIRHKDNSIHWIETKITPTLNEKGTLIRIDGLVSDITERKVAEELLRRKNAELMKSNMELDKFVYSVSHDLRAPLLSMLGIVEISEEETTDAFIQENLGFLKGCIKKLDGFVKDILEYSRNARTEVKNQEINFKEMLTEITGNLKYMGGNKTRQVDVKFEIKNPKLFNSDKNRISILLNNLISNAIRYQDPSTDNPFVDIQIDMSDTETGIIVKDNGIGISKENQKKIFDMFYRVSENSVGSGLGLYLVKEIVEKLEGKMEVESEVGKGTAFSIVLPN